MFQIINCVGCVRVTTHANYMAVWACCDEDGEAAADVDSEELGGCGVEEVVEEEDVAAAAVDDVSTMLLCVMKRSRSFMAGRKVMMIFSTWRRK